MIEYFLLLGAFSAMLLLSFLPGYMEFRAPKDPGPLYIELPRVIEPRSGAIQFRRTIKPLSNGQGWNQKRLWGTSIHEKDFKNNRGKLKISRTDGDITIPAGSVVESALIVLGDLVSQENCKFTEMVYVEGRCQIGNNNKLTAVTSMGNLSIGKVSQVLSFVDSDGAVRIGDGCVIGGLITSGETITIEGSCNAKSFNGHTIKIILAESSQTGSALT